ncbi:MAG: hypothetical protein E6J34_22225 [Chloroflexi bacterium]|nr:MAG: hypothetical protein E6J34_22225 [Chloroflexota bacterium]
MDLFAEIEVFLLRERVIAHVQERFSELEVTMHELFALFDLMIAEEEVLDHYKEALALLSAMRGHLHASRQMLLRLPAAQVEYFSLCLLAFEEVCSRSQQRLQRLQQQKR